MQRLLLFLLNIFFFLVVSNQSYSQKEKYAEDFIHNNKLYTTGSWWLSVGAGRGYFPTPSLLQKSFDVDITGRIKQHYFNIGYHYTGNNSILEKSGQRLNDIHLGYTLRHETLKHNFSVYGGPSYAFGYVFDHFVLLNARSKNLIESVLIDEHNNLDNMHVSASMRKYYKGFRTIGFYGKVQYIHKIFYDIGIGASLYVSANKYYQVVGIQASLYFSTAFIADL